MASSSRQKKKNQHKQSTFQGVLESWFAGDEEGINAYIHEMSRKHINIPKVLDFKWLKSEKLAETRSALKHQKLKKLLELTGNVYPDLVKVFYTNLTLDGKNIVSYVKGIKMKVTSEVWNSVAGIKYFGLKVGKGNTSGIQEFNKTQYYKSCMRNPAQSISRFHAGNLNLTPQLVAYIIAWQLIPRGTNHVVLHEEDLILLYCIMNLIKVNWVYIINEHMLKSKRLTDYRFRYDILVSKLIDYFGIDTSNERNETIKAVSEIDNSTLTEMGFHKVEDSWVILKGKDPQEKHGASNLNNEDRNEVVPMEDDTVQAAEHSCYVIHHSYEKKPSADHAGNQRISSPSVEIRGDSPAPQSMHEEAAATHQNAIVAYQTPEYRGEPLSMFERQILYRLDAMTAEQKAYFETTQARFQHLDDQIEGVQFQLVEL